MKDSNTLHAICRDTLPPVNYLNATSEVLIEFVHDLNSVIGDVSVAYTFDAGPNCFLVFQEKHEHLLKWVLSQTFVDSKDLLFDTEKPKFDNDENLYADLIKRYQSNNAKVIKDFYCTQVGSGPKVVKRPTII